MPSTTAATTLLNGPALAAPLPELEYIIAEIGMVAGGGAPHLVAGYGFAGKTLACQAMALALAAHRSVWGAYRAPREMRVLHVDHEQGERLTRRRYQRLALAMGVELAELGDALAVAAMPPICLTPEHIDTWRELMTGRDVMIVDSLRAATAGADENDSGIRSALDMLGALSDASGCRAIVIHHARKPNADDKGGALRDPRLQRHLRRLRQRARVLGGAGGADSRRASEGEIAWRAHRPDRAGDRGRRARRRAKGWRPNRGSWRRVGHAAT